MHRVQSAGTLGDAGGSTIQLFVRFCAKTALLLACVYLLSARADTIPRIPLELVYSKPLLT